MTKEEAIIKLRDLLERTNLTEEAELERRINGGKTDNKTQ